MRWTIFTCVLFLFTGCMELDGGMNHRRTYVLAEKERYAAHVSQISAPLYVISSEPVAHQ